MPFETPAVELWRRIIAGQGKAWALFEHGTCVIFVGKSADVAGAAVALLRKWGPVHAGSPAGDFSVVVLDGDLGWVVAGHHPDVLTYVPPGAVGSNPSQLAVGLLGRTLRDRDAADLNVIHVEGDHGAEPIRFYSKTAEYHELSNFSPFGFEEGGQYWPTVEHYFQAQKFAGPENAAYREQVRNARTAKDAKAMGRTRKVAIRSDWDRIRDDVMLTALRKKFSSPKLEELLIGTGLRPLVEASPSDEYWGCGRSGKGRNRLGQLLMALRAELRKKR